MALNVYVKEDILNVLRALHVSSEVPAALAVDLLQSHRSPAEVQGTDLPEPQAPAEEMLLAYQKGFRTALAAVALAFGLVPVASAAPTAPLHTAPSRTSERYELDLRSFVESMVRSET